MAWQRNGTCVQMCIFQKNSQYLYWLTATSRKYSFFLVFTCTPPPPGRQPSSLLTLKKIQKEETSVLLGRALEHLVTAFAMIEDWE